MPAFVNQTASFGGIYGLNTTGSVAFSSLTDLDTLLNAGSDATGHWFLGSSIQGSYTNAVLAPAADGVFRLGGGGGILTLTQTNVLVGGTAMMIGAEKGNGTGAVAFLAPQAFTGNTVVAAGSTLMLSSRSDATNVTTTLIVTPNTTITGRGRLLIETRQACGAYGAIEVRGVTNFTGPIELIGTAGSGNKLLIEHGASIPAVAEKNHDHDQRDALYAQRAFLPYLCRGCG